VYSPRPAKSDEDAPDSVISRRNEPGPRLRSSVERSTRLRSSLMAANETAGAQLRPSTWAR
jgi:hypothetical protein